MLDRRIAVLLLELPRESQGPGLAALVPAAWWLAPFELTSRPVAGPSAGEAWEATLSPLGCGLMPPGLESTTGRPLKLKLAFGPSIVADGADEEGQDEEKWEVTLEAGKSQLLAPLDSALLLVPRRLPS